MSDKTILKPRPGARQAPAGGGEPGGDAGPGGDETRITPAGKPSAGSAEVFRLPETRLDPVCDEASRVLALADQLSQVRSVPDLAGLKRQCMALIRDYQQVLQKRQVPSETIENATYCLCALLDERVLNSEWGQGGDWAASSLLSEFHAQTWAGTHFFQQVEEAQCRGDLSLLTLQYLCLSMGFKGRYRLEERGQEQLDRLRESLYRQICNERGRFSTPFDPGWKSPVVPGGGPGRRVPFWAVVAICAVTLLLGYLGFVRALALHSDPVLSQMTGLALPERIQAEPGTNSDFQYLQQILQTEIDRGLVELQEEGRQVRIILGNEGLFDAGSAEIREPLHPVLSKISRALEATEGRIVVTGHTGNSPIATRRYPSNWHLSLARATAVADRMAAGGRLDGRLWPEGRGEAEPRFANDSAENRARNRRVEITLIP